MWDLTRDDFRHLPGPRLVPRYVVEATAWVDDMRQHHVTVLARADSTGTPFALSVTVTDRAWGAGPLSTWGRSDAEASTLASMAGGAWSNAVGHALALGEQASKVTAFREQARAEAADMRAPGRGRRLSTAVLRDVHVAALAAAAIHSQTLVPCAPDDPGRVPFLTDGAWTWEPAAPRLRIRTSRPDPLAVWAVIAAAEADGRNDTNKAVAEAFGATYDTARRWAAEARKVTGNPRGRGARKRDRA